MSAAKVSIIIPAYNAEKWIGAALQSALAQTWGAKEIIVVDDGSTDGTFTAAKVFESKSVKVVTQPNGGASRARNRGLKEAQGDFIQYLDADDLLSPTKIEDQVTLLLNAAPRTLAISDTSYFYDGDDHNTGTLADGWYAADMDDPVRWLIDLLGPEGEPGGMVHPAAWLVPRQLADAVGGWDERLTLDDDGEYFARVVLGSSGVRRSKPGVSYYRKFCGGGSLSGGKAEAHHRSALCALESKERHLLAVTQDARAKSALAKCYTERAILAYPHHPEVTEQALSRAKELGGTRHLPSMGRRMDVLRKLVGWKVARRMNALYHRV